MIKYCKLCGKSVKGCNCSIGWRNNFCSIEHFQQYFALESGEKLKTVFRIETNEGKTDDIIEYNFEKNEIKGRFKTYSIDDVLCFIVPKDEFKNIIKIDNIKPLFEKTNSKFGLKQESFDTNQKI